ncbi:MAG TPA: hypothetical protein VNZ26_34760, partial [Vicinamibacterales bacterium]|nr:hypothetical protein [Vicinamibacterales bacterium]
MSNLFRRDYPVGLAFGALLAFVAPAYAQQPGQPVNESTISEAHQIVSETHHLYFGKVELERGDVKVYADYAEAFTDEDRIILVGNVLFVQGSNRISADKASFNTKTRLGTFYHATGMSTVKPPKPPPPRPGAMAPPPMSTEETVVYFFGDTVEKIGTKKYKIVNGGFTTCVQPTPRWDLHADTVILNIDHYTFLSQAVMTVKGVPMLYTPLLIYPTKSEDRATGFLLPTYGSSSLRGSSIHNAFFWAIDR